MNLSKFLENPKAHFYAISSIWLLLQFYFVQRFGIVTEYEAPKYIEQAQHLLSFGHYTSKNFVFYSTEILLIALGLKTGIGFGLVVFIQFVINAFSIFYFYKTVYFFTKSYKAAFLFTILFLSMIYYHLYNVHLFTESIYYSLTVIYAHILFSINRLTLKNLLIALCVICILYFTRPTGIFFFPATLLYLTIKFNKEISLFTSSLVVAIGLVITYFLINIAMKSGGEFDFLLPYTSKMIICGVPTTETSLTINLPVQRNTLSSLLYLITNHTSLLFELALKRLLAFWGVIRPFYSLPHNIFVGLYFYGIYIIIIWRIGKAIKSFLPEATFFLFTMFLVMLTAMLSCDDWHNRFLLSLLPYLLFLTCLTIYSKSKARKVGANSFAGDKY